MKLAIHPNWNDEVIVTCACGNSFTTGSTKPSIRVAICSACHPYFTGEQRIVDTEGRVERLKRRYGLQ
jgi:large subunit ribosomal protein L31